MAGVPTPVINNQKPTYTTGKYILGVGRLEEEKGFMILVKAVQNTDIPVIIAGDTHSGYGNRVIEYAKKKGIHNVKFVGNQKQKQLQKLYSNCLCVVVPSICYENLPNVALESMSYGKPVIGSDIGSMREVVKEGHNGYLFTVGNEISLRKILKKVISNPKRCRELGKNAYKDAITKYSPETHYKKLMEVFKILKKVGRG